MSFVLTIFEYKTVILFYSLIFLIVYLNRKKFEVHAKFIYLYRTKIGINLMSFVSKKAERLIKFLGHAGVIIGFIGMILTFVMVLLLTYITGWIVIFIIIVVHEFSHGIVASAYKIRIKNSGIAFFGPILGAFVEPDEKILSKQKDWVQHSVFAAGAFSNFLTVILVLLIAVIILDPIGSALSVSTGVIIYSQSGLPAEKAGIVNNTLITGINGENVNTIEDFRNVMSDIGPNRNIELKSDDKVYTVKTIENPDDGSKGYLGVWIMGEKSKLKNDTPLNQALLSILDWFRKMFGWLAFLSLNIGLINLLPIFITDGARMLKIFFERIIPNKNRSMSVWLFVNWVALFSLLILVFLPLFRWLAKIITV